MNVHLERAKHLLASNRSDLAIDALRAGLAEDPNDAELHALLAIGYVESERYDDAEGEVAEALRLGADLAVSHFAQAQLLNAREKTKNALGAINEAIRLDPERAEFYALRAFIHVKRAGWFNVRFSAERGLQLDPTHCGCLNLLSMSYFFTDDVAKAEMLLEHALKLDPMSSLTFCNQGWQRLSSCEFLAAELRFRESLRIDPTLQIAQVGLGLAMLGRRPIYKLMLRFFIRLERRKMDRRRELILTVAVLVPYLSAFYVCTGLFPKKFSVIVLVGVTLPFQLLVASNVLIVVYELFVPYPKEMPRELIASRWRVVPSLLELGAAGTLAYTAYTESNVRYAFGVFALMPVYVALMRPLDSAPADVVAACVVFLAVFGILGLLGTFPQLTSMNTSIVCAFLFMFGLPMVPHILSIRAAVKR